MAHGQRSAWKSNKCGKDLWSRRYPGAAPASPYGKRLTHRYERQKGKRDIAAAIRAKVGRE